MKQLDNGSNSQHHSDKLTETSKNEMMQNNGDDKRKYRNLQTSQDW